MLKELQNLLDEATAENIDSTCKKIIENDVIHHFLPDLFIMLVFHKDERCKEQANELLQKHAPKALLGCIKSEDDFIYATERDISDFLIETASIDSFDAQKLAKLFVKRVSIGGLYCLENNILTAKEVLDAALFTDLAGRKVMNLKNFKLKELPKEIGLFPDIDILYIDGNDFEEVPKTLKKIKDLKGLYWDNTPLSMSAIKDLTSFFPDLMVDYYVKRAHYFNRRGQHEMALEFAKRATELEPQNKGAWMFLSDLYKNEQAYDKALSCLDELLTLFPTYYDGHHAKLMIFIHAIINGNKFNISDGEVIDVCDSGLKTMENVSGAESIESDFLYYKGVALVGLEEYEKGIETYQKLIDLRMMFSSNRHKARAYYNIASIHVKHNRKEEMLAALKEAINLNSVFAKKAMEDSIFDTQKEAIQNLLTQEKND